MKLMTALCVLLAMVLFSAAPAQAAGETVLTVGDEKVSVDEVLYLLGLELGGNDALASVVAGEMTEKERIAFLEKISDALLFSRGAILKGIHLDPKIAAQIRWNQINLLANAYIASLSPRLSFGEKELRTYYEKNRNKYVTKGRALVRFFFTSAEETGRSALLALLSGDDFSSVAERFSSENTATRSRGIPEWIEEGTFPEELDKLAFASPLRKVLGPVSVEGGYCIIEVLERRKAGVLSFSKAREHVRADLERSFLSSEAAVLKKRFPVSYDADSLDLFPVR